MSAFQKKQPWDRNTKYWCQYCQIFIHDNKPSRKLHDTGAKHKENVQRYLRKIDADAEKKRQDEQTLRKELDKIEQAAVASYNKEMGITDTDEKKPEQVKESINKQNDNPDESKETLVNVKKGSHKEERPSHMGIIGAWEVVEEAESSDNEEQSEYSRDTDNKADKVVETPKRKIEETGDFSHASEHFDIREKTIEALPTAHQSNDADGSESAAKGLFKKRRVTGNRSNSRKTIK